MMDEHKTFLLKIARDAISAKLKDEELQVGDVPLELKKNGCCFVTLKINNELRGCIGHLEPFEPLYKNVINNAVNAAFNDERFEPLSLSELDVLKIEVSVLTPPEKVNYDGVDDLLGKISSDHGVILKKGFFQSTFLPQVWDEFSSKEDFLDALSMKAGLNPDAWRHGLEVFVYRVLKFEE